MNPSPRANVRPSALSGRSAEAAARRRKSAPGLVLVLVVLEAAIITMPLPVLPRLLQIEFGLNASETVRFLGLFVGAFAAIQMVVAPLQGALSDRFGRRPMILISVAGLALNGLLLALAPTTGWMVAARCLAGLAVGGYAPAFAYMADMNDGEHRAERLGQVTAAAALGAALGPFAGGLCAEITLRAPFWIAAALSAGAGLYALLRLPESLRAEDRRPLTVHAMHPIGVLLQLWRDFPALRAWSLAYLLVVAASAGVSSTLPAYTAARFAWGPREIGAFGATLAFSGALVLALAVRPAVARFGETRTLLAGLTIQALALLVAAFASTGALLWGAGLLLMLGSVSGPAQSAILLGLVGPSQRGALSGASRSLYGVSAALGPLGFSMLFVWSNAARPGIQLVALPFVVAALVTGLSLLLVLWALRARGVRTLTASAETTRRAEAGS